MRNYKTYILILFVLLCAGCFYSCKPSATGKYEYTGTELFYEPLFAQGFFIEKDGNDKLLHIFNPWQGAENKEFVYRLYPREDTTDKQRTLFDIPVPVERVICLSTTHIAYIDCLQKTNSILGISGAAYVSNDSLLQRYRKGLVRDVGYETGLVYELIVSLQPDVVFAYGVEGEMIAVAERLNELGIRLVYFADYLEEHPLGRAEYLMAMAAFYKEEEKAFDYFDEVAADYMNLCETVQAQVKEYPKVMLNAPWSGVWYFPGKYNYMTVLLQDAAAQLIPEPKDERNSRALSLESAYVYALQADYWLQAGNAHSLRELKASDARFAEIPAFINKKVYNSTRRRTPNGGSDFWESGVVNPHVILRDLVKIFHPEIEPEHELVYYEQLQ